MCTPAQCRYLSQASHVLLALSGRGTIRQADPRRAATLGYDAADLEGKALADLVAPDQRPHLDRILDRLRSISTAWEPLTFLAADGRALPLLCCFQRLAGSDEPRRALLLTGLRVDALESDLRAEAAGVLGQLAFDCHGPAHRLMQAIEAILAEHPACEAAQRCRDDLDRLLEAVSRQAAWPRDLGTERPVDAVRVLEGALRLIDEDPAFQPLKVTLRPECPSAWVNVQPAGLVFVTLHLASNARDAAAHVPAPRLYIDVNAADDRVAIEFKDNGLGLSRQDLAAAFTPCFSKGEGKDGHVGTGLATCCELVRLVGGKMRMQSRPAEGTTVVITLPAAPPPA